MFTSNPFAVLDFLPPQFMPVYIVLMVLAVIIGTLLDVHHKGSGIFFARRRQDSQSRAKRSLGGGDTLACAVATIAEAAVSGEFNKWPRRASHLLMMYGFLIYLITTVAMVFGAGFASLPALWTIGALMVLVGGFWFFFFLRVNVAYDGASPLSLGRADLFIGSLLASIVFALIWQASANGVVFWVYLFFTTLLFGSVPWSKFGHMFFKPAVAFQRRIEEANGSSDLPRPCTENYIVAPGSEVLTTEGHIRS